MNKLLFLRDPLSIIQKIFNALSIIYPLLLIVTFINLLQ